MWTSTQYHIEALSISRVQQTQTTRVSKRKVWLGAGQRFANIWDT